MHSAALRGGSPAKTTGLDAGSRQTRIGPQPIPLGGDVIVGVNDNTVESMADLTVYFEMNTTVGQTVDLAVVRGSPGL